MIIIPGIGMDSLILNKSLMYEVFRSKSKENYEKEGIYLTFEKGQELTSIFLNKPIALTDKGIKVGSSSKEVLKTYGKVEENEIELKKTSKKIGTLGKALIYPGIQFLIDNDKVVGIIIIPFNAK